MTPYTGKFAQPDFAPTRDFVELLISSLNLTNDSKVLIVEFGDQVASHASFKGSEIVHLHSYEPLEVQIDKIKRNGPYDGAILLPAFSVRLADHFFIEPPKDWGDLGRPISEDWLIAHTVNNLKPEGSMAALVPNGLLSNYRRQVMRQELIDRGLVLVASIPNDLIFRDYKNIQIATRVIILRSNYYGDERSVTFVNWVNYANLPTPDDWQEILSGKLKLDDDIVQISIPDLEDEVYRLDPQYYDPTYLQIKPPEGYIEYSLDEIADIRGGFMVDKVDRFELKANNDWLPYLQVRHITYDSEISDKLFWIDPTKVPSKEERLAMPGDILVTVSGTVGKATIVPEIFKDGVFFDTSIRRIRVDSEYARPDWVLRFFQSEIGKLQFRRLTSGSTIPQITTPGLASMRVFLPALNEEANLEELEVYEPKIVEITRDNTPAHLLADAISANVVDYLRTIESGNTNWSEVVEKTLRNLIDDLVPKPLEKVIIEDFPAPIAIPYRRFMMARYNHYERLNRMISLVESCIYFVFHVLVVDYCLHGWQNQVSLSKEAKLALKGVQSIDYRLKFIKDVFDASRSGLVTLFMPELVNTEIVEVGDNFRDRVRNPISHSAPGSEPYVRSLIEKHLPSVNKLLEDLRFLRNYTLCRIRNHYYQNDEWHYQSELYRGAEYDLNIQESNLTETSSEDELIEAERDHLVILSPDAETLDLHPFYQLYFGDETARESHLCFYKYRQGIRLVGESVRSSVEVSLSGIEDFQELTGVNIDFTSQET